LPGFPDDLKDFLHDLGMQYRRAVEWNCYAKIELPVNPMAAFGPKESESGAK
jgi:hypothetical protein